MAVGSGILWAVRCWIGPLVRLNENGGIERVVSGPEPVRR